LADQRATAIGIRAAMSHDFWFALPQQPDYTRLWQSIRREFVKRGGVVVHNQIRAARLCSLGLVGWLLLGSSPVTDNGDLGLSADCREDRWVACKNI
jgi:hypothetical protein